MYGTRVVKKLLGGQKRRLRLRWKDDFELDFRNIGVKRWTRTLEGTKWESLVRGAYARFKGLQC
jgi:hypothetical protein